MKSAIYDFADIGPRLNQIEQEKLAVVMSAPVDETAPKTPNGIVWTDSGDTAPCEYVCWTPSGPVIVDRCAPRFDNAVRFKNWCDYFVGVKI